jgi:SAM-dependent methyltransferase
LSIKQQGQEIIDNIVKKISVLDLEIDMLSTSMFDSDEYRDMMSESKIQGEQFANNLIISAELEAEIISKITEYSNLLYPALQINPKSKKWIDPMVAGDPLYLTHHNISLVKELIKTYPELYQNRLRLYEITDRNFSRLPQTQFSLVLCWDYLNYLSIEKVEKYVRQVWNLLRPGGCFMFSYSNCDLAGTTLRAESWACAYANSRWLKKLCNEIGYEIIELKDFETGDAFNTHVSWAILQKSGKLTTVKAAQAMAKIIHI